jgi:exosome complex component CSL4
MGGSVARSPEAGRKISSTSDNTAGSSTNRFLIRFSSSSARASISSSRGFSTALCECGGRAWLNSAFSHMVADALADATAAERSADTSDSNLTGVSRAKSAAMGSCGAGDDLSPSRNALLEHRGSDDGLEARSASSRESASIAVSMSSSPGWTQSAMFRSDGSAASQGTRMAAKEVVVLPGDELGPISEVQPGVGTFVDAKAGVVRASLAGVVSRVSLADLPELARDGESGRPVMVVRQVGQTATSSVPVPGDVVFGRVLSVGSRQADVTVLVLGDPGKALRAPLAGLIRKEDVRATDVDRVDMLQSFRPGDVVRAAVLSLGDRRSLFLSTAGEDSGVVWARARSGQVMVPVSSSGMRCVETGEEEGRKVARYGF